MKGEAIMIFAANTANKSSAFPAYDVYGIIVSQFFYYFNMFYNEFVYFWIVKLYV